MSLKIIILNILFVEVRGVNIRFVIQICVGRLVHMFMYVQNFWDFNFILHFWHCDIVALSYNLHIGKIC